MTPRHNAYGLFLAIASEHFAGLHVDYLTDIADARREVDAAIKRTSEAMAACDGGSRSRTRAALTRRLRCLDAFSAWLRILELRGPGAKSAAARAVALLYPEYTVKDIAALAECSLPVARAAKKLS